jgi:Reverse transcriptase (RNA-dependent DNA polymerase)
MAVFKVDIQKAFDLIEWFFIIKCLQVSSFPHNLINWIKFLVLKENSKVIINSVAEKDIKLRRSVRQGDLISSYIFHIVIDFLARWINKMAELQLLRAPFHNCRMCLLYADDALLFLQPHEQQIKIFKMVM